MAFKRNLKMYMKEKSTIVAFCFFIPFLTLSLVSFIPSLQNIKGLRSNFKSYDIDYITTNNYSVTYAVSGNHLFYSQCKSQQSTLNDFAGIEDYSNEYGSQNVNEYNFISIQYDFPTEIKEVKGLPDNMVGQDGETFIITKSNGLYEISDQSDSVEKIDDNINSIEVKYDSNTYQCIYLIQDTLGKLYYASFENNQLVKELITSDFSDYFYYVGSDTNGIEIITQEQNELFLYTYSNGQAIKENLNITSEKIVNNEDNFYVLNNGNVSLLTFDTTYQLTKLEGTDFKDIYTCGTSACIAIKNNDDLYYVGNLKYYENDSDTFESLNMNGGRIYGNRNSLIYQNNKGKLYLYDKDSKSFQAMYENYIMTKIIRYGGLFVTIMILFYFIMSFIENNSRYNRYFKHLDNKKR